METHQLAPPCSHSFFHVEVLIDFAPIKARQHCFQFQLQHQQAHCSTQGVSLQALLLFLAMCPTISIDLQLHVATSCSVQGEVFKWYIGPTNNAPFSYLHDVQAYTRISFKLPVTVNNSPLQPHYYLTQNPGSQHIQNNHLLNHWNAAQSSQHQSRDSHQPLIYAVIRQSLGLTKNLWQGSRKQAYILNSCAPPGIIRHM